MSRLQDMQRKLEAAEKKRKKIQDQLDDVNKLKKQIASNLRSAKKQIERKERTARICKIGGTVESVLGIFSEEDIEHFEKILTTNKDTFLKLLKKT